MPSVGPWPKATVDLPFVDRETTTILGCAAAGTAHLALALQMMAFNSCRSRIGLRRRRDRRLSRHHSRDS